jgi:hypothetical protein
MKKSVFLVLLFILGLSTVSAQMPDFDLYFANNVTDVVNLDSIESPNSGLTWTKVLTADGDMAGNYAEVEKVKQMLGSTRKKWLADQRLFWTMRDHSLLCFRINDAHPTKAGYEVMLDNQHGDTLVIAANQFFFTNLPLQEDPYVIKVYRADKPEQCYRFRYFIDDWDNERLYIFQLDQRRQATGKNYVLECTTGYLDEDGEMQKTTTMLDLQASSFQSIYVPEKETLLDVVLNDDGNRLRLDKKKLNPGIDINDAFKNMELSNTFELDKHENREFMNFNWVGSGLYEQYDTLYIAVWNERAQRLANLTCHVVSVDADGKPVGDIGAKYIGYDKERKVHKILTMGHPAYIEVISSGYLPTVYKYAGAADEETGIVSEARCNAQLTLRKGAVKANGLTISDQNFLSLNDEKIIIVRNKQDYAVCSIDPIDLSGWVQADTLTYFEDAAQQYLKMLDNKPIERFAKLQVAFSRPKGTGAPDCQLFTTDISSNAVREATDKDITTILAVDYPTFTYDYYYVDFNLLDVIPVGSVCSALVKSGNYTYDQFPFLQNMHLDREENKKQASNEVNHKYTGDNSGGDGFADAGWDLRLPFKFKFSFKPVTVTTSVIADIRKRLGKILVNIQFNREDKPGESEKFKGARDEMKEIEKYNDFDINDNVRESIVGEDKSFEGWIYDDIDDIFNISSKRIGVGFYGGAKMSFVIPNFDMRYFKVAEASGQIGYGVGMFWSNLQDNPKLKYLKKVMDLLKGPYFSACAEANAQLDFGIKSFTPNEPEVMSSKSMGYFAHISTKATAGATLGFLLPDQILGIDIAWLCNFHAGLQFGGKLGFQCGIEGPFDNITPGTGARLTAMLVGNAFISVKALLVSWSAKAGFHLGGQLLIPDNPHNPFHSKFPYWLLDTKARKVGEVYSPLRAPAAGELGRQLVSDVAIDANPHFTDSLTVIYNDLQRPDDYNDDRITAINTVEGRTGVVSTLGTSATNHMRSKHGEREIVVYEQKGRQITDEEVNSDDAVAISFNMPTYIAAAMRTSTGEWQRMNVTEPDEDPGMVDTKPVVTVQDDGHAACIYLHGTVYAADANMPLDTLSNVRYKGQLMLRTYDGTRWSAPTPLYFPIDENHTISQYDLLMRGDTVLVAANIKSPDFAHQVLRYASKPLASSEVTYSDDSYSPCQFMMQRVGKNAVLTMVYDDTTDSLPEVLIRTLKMSGSDDNMLHSKLGVGYKRPGRVKIVCDREATNINDFAVLWTEANNVVRGDDGTNSYTDNICTMLNASRVHIGQTLQMTDPITVGAEQDSLVMTDFDGYLDDAHISVAYTLANPETGAGVIMVNDKYFRNSCETEVSYARQALRGSTHLPVSVRIRNTGTSPVIGAEVIINGEEISIDSVYVSPAKEKTYTVLYPIADDFDGYITSTVNVTYNNIFKAKAHPRRRAMSFVRQQYSKPRTRLTVADVECNVVSQSIEDGANTFVIELIDHDRLPSDCGVRVGVYAHPGISEPLDDTSEVLLQASDFVQMGDQRRAYATVSVGRISEPLQAYVNCHVQDLNVSTSNNYASNITNRRSYENAALVNLFPYDNPTRIVRPTVEGSSTNHRIQVTVADNGINLSHLQPGESIRIFNTEGFMVFKQEAKSSTLFVPLSVHGVYVLGSNDEVFKFIF